MNHLKIIREFLAEKRSLHDVPESGLPFITISREAGAGGHLLSYLLLNDFMKQTDTDLFQGWHVFDRDLCQVIAQDPALRDSVEALVSEQYRSEFQEFIESLFTGRSSQYALYKATFRVVRLLAAVGKVIVVGRGGACVTRDLCGGVHIRLVAEEPRRLLWMMKRFKLTKEEARQWIDRQDNDRRKLIARFFNRDIASPLLYDAVFNTGDLDMHVIAQSVIAMTRSRHARMSAPDAPPVVRLKL
jgi:cytidylate kinase